MLPFDVFLSHNSKDKPGVRAWLRFLTGARTGPESAQADLDEAWEIAERGPMPLFMADIHLHRARLFGSQKPEVRSQEYPWNKNLDGTPRGPKDDLAEARRLIEKHGYGRRKEELKDAERAMGAMSTIARERKTKTTNHRR